MGIYAGTELGARKKSKYKFIKTKTKTAHTKKNDTNFRIQLSFTFKQKILVALKTLASGQLSYFELTTNFFIKRMQYFVTNNKAWDSVVCTKVWRWRRRKNMLKCKNYVNNIVGSLDSFHIAVSQKFTTICTITATTKIKLKKNYFLPPNRQAEKKTTETFNDF